MYAALLDHPERARFDTSALRRLRLGRRGDAGGGDARLRAGVRLRDPRGLRPVSETSPVASFNHPDRERKPGSIGTPVDGVEMKLRGRAVDGGRRDRHPRPQRHEGLLAPPGRDRRGDPRTAGSTPATWRASTRTATSSSSTARRTWSSAVATTSTRARSRRCSTSTRRCARRPSSACRTPSSARRSAPPSCSRPARTADEREIRDFVKAPGGRVQVPAARLVRGRAAEGPHRQDPQARDQGTRPRDRRGALTRPEHGNGAPAAGRARPLRRRSRCCSRTPRWAAGRGFSSRAPQAGPSGGSPGARRGGPPRRRPRRRSSPRGRGPLGARAPRKGDRALRRPRLARELAPAPAAAELPGRRRDGRRL